MPLSAGDKLGPYEILGSIGAGGMGEVYRAQDTRLRRDVAIKVSAERFSERFETEARAIASLNHPNVCTLHDVGPNYLVMELVEGQTLAARIDLGAIPLDEALAIAKQIADALEAAHEKGITHRDLKPGNIKIKPDGVVKVLDFGLAKMGGTPTAKSDNSPTLTMGATQAGVILGTAAYMAPEQARGKEVDKRADIWAFGVVFYEMLTGKRLFQGEDLTETLASVVKDEPRLKEAPASVRRLLKKCLEKDPKKRLRDIGDVWGFLEDEPAGQRPTPQIMWPAMAALLAVIAGVALWAPWRVSRPIEQPLVQVDVDLGPEISLRPLDSGPTYMSSVIISPDGMRLVYAASVAGGPVKLFIRKLDQPKALELPGTEGVTFPFFSPDGLWVGFSTSLNKLNKISVDGGAIVPLADLYSFGASWGEDGNIIASRRGDGMVWIPSNGGAANPVTELASGESGHSAPQILPGGKAMLFQVYRGIDFDNARVEVISFADRRRRVLVQGGTSPRYVATSTGAGHLVYSHRGTLFAIPFDLNRRETRGTAVPVLDGVAYAGGPYAHFDVSGAPSGHGMLVYRKARGGAAGRVTTVQWLDAAGKMEPLLAKPGRYVALRLSPDGQRLAVDVNEGSSPSRDVWVYDHQRDAMTRLTFGGGPYSFPIWSPDGRYVVFSSATKGIFWARADGAGQPEALMQSKTFQYAASFSPDGKRLAYFESNSASGSPSMQIWTAPIEDRGGQLRAGTPERFLKTSFSDAGPMFSPDGQWLAYESDQSGKYEVYVRAFPPPASGQSGKWQISNSGGRSPVWSRNSRELLYRTGDQIMAVNYAVKGDSFMPEKPRVWVSKLGGATWFDLAPDGKRLAVIVPVDTPEAAPKPEHEVTFVFNFFDELRRRVPLGK